MRFWQTFWAYVLNREPEASPSCCHGPGVKLYDVYQKDGRIQDVPRDAPSPGAGWLKL